MAKARTIETTQTQVEVTTDEQITRQIRRELEARLCYYAQCPEEIDARLEELDREWDIERLLETNVGVLSVLGLTLGAVHRKWYLLSGLAGAFLVQHAVEGSCLPVQLFRRLGIRTTQEINRERVALKALRGDFDGVRVDGDLNPRERAGRAVQAADSPVRA
jgi:hypothetical protein